MLTRESITAQAVHHWPDLVGRLIEPESEADPHTTRDDNCPGMTLADVWKEWLVQERGLPAS